MSRPGSLPALPFCALMLVLAGCGGGGDGGALPPPDKAPINTFAYVHTACRDGADGFSATQELRVRRGENPQVTVKRVSIGPLHVPLTYCVALAFARDGEAFHAIGAFQRLGVSPDGTVIVFEVTDDFSILGQSFVPPDEKGIFSVRADGSGLRRLGDASRVPTFNTSFSNLDDTFEFSPDGRVVAFTDMGPESPGGPDAGQAFILDVATGKHTQVTHLPPAPFAGNDGTNAGPFLNDRILGVGTRSNLDGDNPDAKLILFGVNIDDGKRQPGSLSTVVLPGGGVIEVPIITGSDRIVVGLNVPGVPVNPLPGASEISEVLSTDGTNALQLTNFQRVDTSGAVLSVDGERVFFTASVNPPVGTNPFEVCQIFSVDALGGALRQLTEFGASRPSAFGCDASHRGEGCSISLNQTVSQDVRTGTLVFSSSCDPFGTNPNGEQIFAMRRDGSGLHALTDLRGLVRNSDGSFEAELPGPWSYGPHR